MPKVFNVLGYHVYFWSNEGYPLEPVHVHVSKSIRKNGTKFWLYSDGTVHLESNASRIGDADISKITRILAAHYDEIVFCWESYFDEKVKFYDVIHPRS